MSEIRLVRDYPHSPAQVWRALTDPALMNGWMVAASSIGFEPVVGTRFKFVGPPQPGWSGIVDCEVLEAIARSRLRYSWLAQGDREVMHVTYGLEAHGPHGTRFTFEHTGFTGLGGYLLSQLIMTPIRKKMFGERITAVLNGLAAPVNATAV